MKPYYDEAGIRIYHGDGMDLLALQDPSPASAIITDPPYGVRLVYDQHVDHGGERYWAWMRNAVVTMTGLVPTVVFTHRVAALRELSGWDWLGVWNKPNAMSGLNWLPIMPHWEPVFMYGIGGRKDLPRGFDVFTYMPDLQRDLDHPAVKPLGLYRELVGRFSRNTDLVIDPFMGSGTTLRAAKDLGRRAIGIEKSERYCEIAAKRLAQEVFDFVPVSGLGTEGTPNE